MSGIFFPRHIVSLGAVLPSVSYQGTARDGVSRTTYTFTSQPLGTPSASRRIIVVVHGTRNVGGNRSVSSGTIDGVATTSHINRGSGSGDVTCVNIISAACPSANTSATIAVTMSGSLDCAAISIFAAYDLLSGTPTTGSGQGTTANCNVNTTAGGIVVAGGTGAYGTTYSMTGVTASVSNQTLASVSDGMGGFLDVKYGAGCVAGVVTATPRSVSGALAGGSGFTGVAVSAAWR